MTILEVFTLFDDEEGRSVIDFVKPISIKDVVYMTAAAWEDISAYSVKVLEQAAVSCRHSRLPTIILQTKRKKTRWWNLHSS